MAQEGESKADHSLHLDSLPISETGQSHILTIPAQNGNSNMNDVERLCDTTKGIYSSMPNNDHLCNDDASNANLCNNDGSPSHNNIPTLNSDLVLRQSSIIDVSVSGEHINARSLHPTLEYLKGYPITRYARKWKRQEVQGFCCLAVDIMCLTILATISLQGLGYMESIGEQGHVAHSFSWKILREFFIYDDYSAQDKDCLFYAGAKKQTQRQPLTLEVEYDYGIFRTVEAIQPLFSKAEVSHRDHCEYTKQNRSVDWLLQVFSSQLASVINVIAASIYLCFISARRTKGLQVMLLVPALLCFFVTIFQQIPTTFRYNYVSLELRDDMRSTHAHSLSPFNISPIWEETQIHMQCCGIEFPASWESRGSDEHNYPGSCCNVTAYNCKGKLTIPKHQVWSDGCYDKEYNKIRKYEKWGMLLFFIKICAEVGIFCTLSDLTRYDYPPVEVIENSSCDFGDYHIRCRGILRLRGITKDGRVVVEARHLIPWRLIPSRTDTLTGLILHVRTDFNRTKGSVEIAKRNNAAEFLSEDIGIDFNMKNRGIFIFSLL